MQKNYRTNHVIQSDELAAVQKHSAEWAEWVREHEGLKNTEILDENGEPFLDGGSYLDYLRETPDSN